MLLTDRHLALLRAAATRDDGLLPRPDRLVGAASNRMASRLVDAGVAEPVPVLQGQPHWSKDTTGAPLALRITDAGRAACTAGGDVIQPSQEDDRSTETSLASRAEPSSAAPIARVPPREARLGTKRALLLDLLGREGGATINMLVEALGWQAHAVRAALTRLRQGGAAVERSRDAEGHSRYRLEASVALVVLAPGDSSVDNAGADGHASSRGAA